MEYVVVQRGFFFEMLFKEVCPTEIRVYGLKTQGRRNGGSPNQASYSKSVAHISCWADGLRPGVFWDKQNGGSRKFDFDPEGRPKSQVASTTQKENEVIEHADFSIDRTEPAAMHASRHLHSPCLLSSYKPTTCFKKMN